MNTIPLGVFGPYQLIFIGLLIPIVVFILFAVSMQKAMNTVSSPNRKMDGGLIWLILIPLLNLVWPFIFNSALRESYRKEFSQKGIPNTVNLSSGIIYPSAQVLILLLALIQLGMFDTLGSYSQSDLELYMILSVISGLVGLLSFILWIVFWVNVNTLREVLVNHNQSNAFSNSGQQPTYSQPTQHQNPPYSPPVPEHYPSQEATPPPPPPQAPIPEPVKPVSTVDKLKKYHDMLSEGLITQADFDRIKNELLNQK
jgi:hypothetical protein